MESFLALAQIPLAFALDLLLGDPRRLPHPIRWMGRAIVCLEPCFRRLPMSLVSSGTCFAASLIAGTWGLTTLLLRLAASVDPILSRTIEIILLFYCLSAASLASAAQSVSEALKQNRMEQARCELAMIVGRDVKCLSRQGMIRATIETVAENLVDGVLSPLFYAAIGGAPLALAYKMSNTLDSMVGYKNEKYEAFGKGSARMDDLANCLPARLSVLTIAAAAWLTAGPHNLAWKTAWQEGRRHTSPNAGYPEAAFAGALGIKLGGPSTYQGVRVEKPFIGSAFGAAGQNDITRACQLMFLSAFLGLLLTVLTVWL